MALSIWAKLSPTGGMVWYPTSGPYFELSDVGNLPQNINKLSVSWWSEDKIHNSKKMTPSDPNPKNQNSWKMFSRRMALSILKSPAAFIAGVRELPEVDCDNCTGLLLVFGLVWVGDGMFESGGEAGWIVELLEGSEDGKEVCAVMAWVLPQVWAAVVATGHLAMMHVAAWTMSPQSLVTSETIRPGTFSRSDTIAPDSMSLKILTASVTTAPAAPMIWVGKLAKMPTTFEKAPMTSFGRSWMIVGTLPSSSSSIKFLASSASFSNVRMTLQGMSLRRSTIWLDRKRAWTIRLVIALVSKRLTP